MPSRATACNTASAKALRTIQQNDLPAIDPSRRVLGVIRPTVEKIGDITRNGNIGIVGTAGTVRSRSYDMEINKLYPGFNIFSQACPMWAPLVENGEADKPGADYFVKRDIDLLISGAHLTLFSLTRSSAMYQKAQKYCHKAK